LRRRFVADHGGGLALHRFGRALGLAFQITDDLMDYLGAEKVTGKAMGNDLDGGKITLPLINALREAPERERREMEDLIRSRDFRNGHWSDVVRFVTVHGGVAYSQKDCLDIIEQMGIAVDSVRFSGGGARSEFWHQMLADVFGKRVSLLENQEGSAFGAALLALAPAALNSADASAPLV